MCAERQAGPVDPPSWDSVRDLANRLTTPDQHRQLREIVHNFVLTTDSDPPPAFYPALLAVLHSGIEHSRLREKFVALWSPQTPARYWRAFQREIGLIPSPRVVDFFVENGFTEILESVFQLETVEELEFYWFKLNESQQNSGLEKLAVPSFAVLKNLVFRSPCSECQPKCPQYFRTAESLHEWYADYIHQHQLTKWALKWDKVVHRAAMLPLVSPVTVLPSIHPETDWFVPSLVLLPELVTPAISLTKINDVYLDHAAVADYLKIEAGKSNAVYSRSLSAAQIGFERTNRGALASIAQQLVVTELLPPSEQNRYFALGGADLYITNATSYADLLTTERNGPKNKFGWSHIFFPHHCLSDPKLRLAIMLVLADQPAAPQFYSACSLPSSWPGRIFQPPGVTNGRTADAAWVVAAAGGYGEPRHIVRTKPDRVVSVPRVS